MLDNEYRGGAYADDAGTSYDPSARTRQTKVMIPFKVHDSDQIPGAWCRVRISLQSSDLAKMADDTTTFSFQGASQAAPWTNMDGPKLRGVEDQADSFMGATTTPYHMVTGSAVYLVELMDDTLTTVYDSVTVTYAPTDGYRHSSNGPTYVVNQYGVMDGATLSYPADSNSVYVNLYGGTVPSPRPSSDALSTVPVDLTGWTIDNQIGEQAELWIETVDDAPLVSISPIASGSNTDFGTVNLPPGAQVRIDQIQAVDGDPNVLSVLHISGEEVFTVPPAGGPWASEWLFTLPGANTEYSVTVNVANTSTVGGSLEVLYNGSVATVIPITALSTGQQTKAHRFTLSVPAPLGLTFSTSVGIQSQLLNGPSVLNTNYENVYDVAVYDGGETFTVNDSVQQTVTDEDGNEVHQGATYERQLGDGTSLYWTTGAAPVGPGETVIDPVTQRASGNVTSAGNLSGNTPEEVQANTDVTGDMNSLATGFGNLQDAIEGSQGVGRFGSLLNSDNTLGAGSSVAQANVWTLSFGTWFGFDLPTYDIQLDQTPFPQVRLLMLVILSLVALREAISYLKV